MTPAQRTRAKEHIAELAAEHRVKLRWKTRRWESQAHVETRQAWVPKAMRSPLDYFIALHELGHVVSPLAALLHNGSGASWEFEFTSEAAAWSWAYESADPELLRLMTQRDWLQVAGALMSYIGPPKKRQGKTRRPSGR
jgi:hypothetical protein